MIVFRDLLAKTSSDEDRLVYPSPRTLDPESKVLNPEP